MAEPAVDRRLLGAFAELLEYPRESPAAAARACAAGLAPRCPEAAALVEAFAARAAASPVGDVQELYTLTFDLATTGCPYVGYHLFGESYKRSVFLLRLKAACAAAGLAIGSELPDHLAMILRLIAASDDGALADELITEALVPALDRMLGGAGGPPTAEDEGSPPDDLPGQDVYRGLLRALRLSLPPGDPAFGGAADRRPTGDPEPFLTR